MKAHSMRRTLWITSVALGAAVLGLAAWFVTDVKKEVEAVPRVDSRLLAKDAKQLDPTHRDIKGALDSFRTQVTQVNRERIIRAPVSEERLKKVILRDDTYKKMVPSHWIFSGPMPSGKYPEPPKAKPTQKAPEGLSAIGKATQIWLLGDGGGLLTFRFNKKNDKAYRFREGQWIWPYGKEGPTPRDGVPAEERRFRIKEFRALEPEVFEVVAEVFNDPDKPPVKLDRMRWSARVTLDPNAPIRLLDSPQPSTAQPGPVVEADPEGAAGASDADPATAGATDSTSTDAPATDTPGADTPKPTTTDSGAGAVAVAPGDDRGKFTRITPADELKADDLRPTFERDAKRPDTTNVRVDDNSYRYFKHHGVKKIIEEVKTKPNKHGVEIQSTGSAPIENFRIKRGDTIVAVNDQPVKTRSDIVRIAEGLPESTRFVKITLMSRTGTRRSYNVDVTDPKNRRDVARYGNVGGG